ncbi:hypothetical protein OTSKARP_0693 [Orientia tsutsugamushi str. Karp]|nr:hypothetical protein OTSKARP_0693 [Orientia tsutsugamushi str. Karp]
MVKKTVNPRLEALLKDKLKRVGKLGSTVPPKEPYKRITLHTA